MDTQRLKKTYFNYQIEQIYLLHVQVSKCAYTFIYTNVCVHMVDVKGIGWVKSLRWLTVAPVILTEYCPSGKHQE